jgi:hypothetical protein
VKTWAEVIRDCDTRLKFIQDQLQIEVSAEEIQERIAKLKASVLKSDLPDNEGQPPVEGKAAMASDGSPSRPDPRP